MKKYAFYLAVLAFSCASSKLTTEEINALKAKIENRNYSFIAQTALPATGRPVPLTSNYDLRVQKDSVISFLPYFGRAFSLPTDMTKSAMMFTSTRFSYEQTINKKGDYIIQIKPQDVQEIQLITINVSKEGYGTLQINSINRQPISFNGIIYSK